MSKMMTVSFVVVVMALVPAVALAWTDTFEDFTPDVTVAGQGDYWDAIYGSDHAIVRNDAATAYEGDQYLDIWNSTYSTYPRRIHDEPMNATTNYKVTYYQKIGDPEGTKPQDAYHRFTWSTGHYPPSTMVSTSVWYGGTLGFYQGITWINTGVIINQGEWYKHEYTYDLVDEVQWLVTRTADSSVVLDVNIATEAGVVNQDWSWCLGFNPGSYAPPSGFHSLLDNVSLTPDYIEVMPGDANDDQKVTDADYTIWADTYGSTTDLRADWNDSSDVTDADYTIWADHYGDGVTSVAVPEPATLAMLGLGALGLLRKRR